MRQTQKHQTLLIPLLILSALCVCNAGIPPVSGYSWIAMPALSTNRTDLTATLIGTKFYIVGGCTSVGDGCTSVDGLSTAHEAYDVLNYTVQFLPNSSIPRYRHVARAIGNSIYVVGGRTANDVPVAELEIFNLENNSWSFGAPFPDARSDSAAFVLNGKFYVYGGYNADYSVTYANGYYYDPAQDVWTLAGSLTQERGDLMATILDGVVYVAGGFNASFDDQPTVDVSRDGSNWTRLTPALNEGRGDGVFLSLSGNLLLIGGESAAPNGTDVIATDVQVWRAGETTWRYLTPLPDERYRMAGDTVNGGAWVFGGHDSNEIPSNLVNKLVFSAASSLKASFVAVLGALLVSFAFAS